MVTRKNKAHKDPGKARCAGDVQVSCRILIQSFLAQMTCTGGLFVNKPTLLALAVIRARLLAELGEMTPECLRLR